MVSTIDPVLLALSLAQAFMVSLIVTYVLLPWVMSNMRKRGITGPDKNKLEEPIIPEMGGVGVVIGYFSGLFTFLLSYKFIFAEDLPYSSVLLAGMFCILGAAFVGAIDDLFDLKQRVKAVLPMFFAIPLAYYTITTIGTEINLFSLIVITVPWFFMAFIVLFGVTAAANGANMLEGYNGLGAGLAIIIASFLSIVSIYQHNYLATFFLVPLIAASLAFLKYNYYPAKVFPGDVYTLFYGATIAVAVVYGNMKELGSLLFIPMMIEFILKIRSKFEAENFTKPNKRTGHLEYRGPSQSLIHFVIKRVPMNEKYLVWGFWFLQVVICVGSVPFVLISS